MGNPKCRAIFQEQESPSVLQCVYSSNWFSYFAIKLIILSILQRPEKFLGEIETWDRAEKALENALNSFGKPWQVGFLLLKCSLLLLSPISSISPSCFSTTKTYWFGLLVCILLQSKLSKNCVGPVYADKWSWWCFLWTKNWHHCLWCSEKEVPMCNHSGNQKFVLSVPCCWHNVFSEKSDALQWQCTV